MLMMRGSQRLVVWVGLPVLEVVLGIVQDLPGLRAVEIRPALFTWHDGAVVKELQEAAAVAGEDDLLLGALNGGEKLGVIGLLEFLASLDIYVSATPQVPRSTSPWDKRALRPGEGEDRTHNIG